MYRKLRRDGEAVSRKRVARLMKEHGIKAKRVKKSRHTTDSRHSLPVAENVLARRFRATRPDEVWTSDITYVWTAQGWLYLVVFLDLYSRLVVGWAVNQSRQWTAQSATGGGWLVPVALQAGRGASRTGLGQKYRRAQGKVRGGGSAGAKAGRHPLRHVA
jgi:transposase InsO family protein